MFHVILINPQSLPKPINILIKMMFDLLFPINAIISYYYKAKIYNLKIIKPVHERLRIQTFFLLLIFEFSFSVFFFFLMAITLISIGELFRLR